MTNSRFLSILSLFAAVLLFSNLSSAAPKGTPNINDLMTAELIFTGTCTAADAGFLRGNKGMVITTYTFKVQPANVVKGSVPSEFTFRQVGASPENLAKLGSIFKANTPSYEVGKDYLLFVTSETNLSLRTTVGFGAGSFSVVTDANGKKTVVNAAGNSNLFKDVPQTKSMTKAMSAGGVSAGAKTSGPMDYDSFIKMVKELKEGR